MTPELERLRAETDAVMPDAFSRYRALAAERAAVDARIYKLVEVEHAARRLSFYAGQLRDETSEVDTDYCCGGCEGDGSCQGHSTHQDVTASLDALDEAIAALEDA